MTKSLIKQAVRNLGYDIRSRDRLAEFIPPAYVNSPFLPTITNGGLRKLFYFKDMVEHTSTLSGNIVECGVSTGRSALLLLLLSDYIGVKRTYYGFDSFEGFPEPTEDDGPSLFKPQQLEVGSPPAARLTLRTGELPQEVVFRTLRDGGIPDNMIQEHVRLVKGWFHETLPTYHGNIALLHLDCDLYESYLVCLQNLYDKVVRGGVIMFDEYDTERWPGATKAIDEFFKDKPEAIKAHESCDWKYFVVKK